MNHYLITIQYDGSAHRGWQRLANEPDTVQGILENALSAYFKESIRITGSGRTDAGVHALRQYADFFCRASLNIQDTQFLTDFNKTLPSDIRVTSIRPVSAGFHSRKSAVSKTYTYYTMLSGKPDVFFKNYAYCPADTPFRLKNADLPPLSYPKCAPPPMPCAAHTTLPALPRIKRPVNPHVRRIDSVTVDTVTLPSGIKSFYALPSVETAFYTIWCVFYRVHCCLWDWGRFPPHRFPQLLKEKAVRLPVRHFRPAVCF